MTPLTTREQLAATHLYEIRTRKHKRGVDLISAVLPFGRLWYGDANAVANAFRRIRVDVPPPFPATLPLWRQK